MIRTLIYLWYSTWIRYMIKHKKITKLNQVLGTGKSSGMSGRQVDGRKFRCTGTVKDGSVDWLGNRRESPVWWGGSSRGDGPARRGWEVDGTRHSRHCCWGKRSEEELRASWCSRRFRHTSGTWVGSTDTRRRRHETWRSSERRRDDRPRLTLHDLHRGWSWSSNQCRGATQNWIWSTRKVHLTVCWCCTREFLFQRWVDREVATTSWKPGNCSCYGR